MIAARGNVALVARQPGHARPHRHPHSLRAPVRRGRERRPCPRAREREAHGPHRRRQHELSKSAPPVSQGGNPGFNTESVFSTPSGYSCPPSLRRSSQSRSTPLVEC
jgi:hypothetical protein